MNGNTERAQCALSLVCIPQEMEKSKTKFIKYLKSVIQKGYVQPSTYSKNRIKKRK